MRIAVPDFVSNSYFPAIAAMELGFFAREGLAVEHELIFPNYKAYEALREGRIDFVAGPAHVTLKAFPRFEGAKLLAALSQGIYWLLVLRADVPAEPGDVRAVEGRTIGAAPMVELGLRHLLRESGIDLARVRIVGVPGTEAPGVSFGVAAAKALAEGKIDGFWANAMGAEVAIRSGVGKVMLDVRRGLGPARAFHYTFPALVTSERAIVRDRHRIAAGLRAVVAAQAALKADVSLAARAGQALFPPTEAALLTDVIARDLPFYAPHIPKAAVVGLNGFAHACGLLDRPAPYEDVVATEFSHLWQSPA
ncbi:MAG TPA: ABC transporter substrate-binding protein [Xanthobacteraceae bacterium]|nr:ABC transporter substrate-binding protein [Xanthobacteraceae bacterium]